METPFDRSRRATASPSIPGIATSRTIASGGRRLGPGQGRPTVGDRVDGVALGGQRPLEHSPDRGVVLDDEDACGSRASAMARTIGGDGESHVRNDAREGLASPAPANRSAILPVWPTVTSGGPRFCRSSGSAAWACSPVTGSRASSPGPLGAAGSVVPQGLKDILPIGGWRIYAINPPWPEFHPAQYRLEVTGPRPKAGHAARGTT